MSDRLRSIWWPSFHDPSFAPPLREQLSLHWKANLGMLRSPRAIASFCVLSLLPTLVLVAGILVVEATTKDLAGILSTTGGLVAALVVGAAYLLVQHVTFVVAMNRSYGPFVRSAMRNRGIRVCERCGHLLPPSGLPSTCGECGAHAADLARPRA
ncbi:MAG: hypothetical protein JNM94_03935 [Phycisphaerae bacterium]|nr:hypothetical protein [Phycisphaerae bacterium]